jgi:hypothetical protein
MSMTFGQMQSEVFTWLIDTPTAVQTLTPVFINRAMHKLQMKHDFKCMEAETMFVTSNGTRTLGAVPALWKKPRNAKPYLVEQLGPVRELNYVSTEGEAKARWGDNSTLNFGAPRLVAEDNPTNTFLFYPYSDQLSDYPDGQYRIYVPYWAFLPNLVNADDTNWFTLNGEQAVVYQAVAMGFLANQDEQRAAGWNGLAVSEMKDLVQLDKERRSAETASFTPHLGARMPHVQE